MHLLYIDESGNPHDPTDRFFVISGVSVFERTTFYLSRELEALQTKYLPGSPPVEFHAAPIRSGTGFWRRVDKAIRDSILVDIAAVIANANQRGLVLFGAAIEKDSTIHGEEAIKLATEQVCSRLYERRNPDLIRPILDRFDHKNGILHGLVHESKNKRGCECPACFSRRAPHNHGTWMTT